MPVPTFSDGVWGQIDVVMPRLRNQETTATSVEYHIASNIFHHKIVNFLTLHTSYTL